MTYDEYKRETFANACEIIAEYGSDDPTDFHSVFYELQMDDAITGNASGSYTMDRAKAADNAGGVVFDADFRDWLDGCGFEKMPTDPETVDVLARCAALDALYQELEAWFVCNCYYSIREQAAINLKNAAEEYKELTGTAWGGGDL